jgi:hypothetical protein
MTKARNVDVTSAKASRSRRKVISYALMHGPMEEE